jgi:predicted PurR-regulated permease PerM
VAATPVRRFRFGPVLSATVLTVLLLWLLGRAAEIFLLLFLAILIALYLGAVTDQLHHRLRVPRRLAFAAAVFASLAALVGLFALLVPPVVDQTQQLIAVLPNYLGAWELQIERLARRIPALQDSFRPGQHTIVKGAYEQLASSFGGFLPRVFSVVEGAISVFSVLGMGLYLALTPALYREWLIALLPPVHRDLARDIAGDVATTLRAYIVGQLTAMMVLAVLTGFILWLLQVPYWLTFGVFTGVVAIVPFFGTLVSTLLPALFVLGQPGGGTKALMVIGAGVVIHLIEGNVVGPLIMSKKVELPPVLSIMAVLVCGKLLGLIGLIVAVPLLAVSMVIVRRIVVNRVYQGPAYRRTTRDRALTLRVPAPEGGVIMPEGTAPDLIAIAEAVTEHRAA